MIFQKFNNRGGFTLTEIIVTVIIVGILASVALPRFTGVFERVRAAEGVQILTALLGAQKVFEAENGSYASGAAGLAALDVEIDRAKNFNLPPTVSNPADPVANPIATITRTGAYILGINEEGRICCKNSGAAFTCAQAGITVACP